MTSDQSGRRRSDPPAETPFEKALRKAAEEYAAEAAKAAREARIAAMAERVDASIKAKLDKSKLRLLSALGIDPDTKPGSSFAGHTQQRMTGT